MSLKIRALISLSAALILSIAGLTVLLSLQEGDGVPNNFLDKIAEIGLSEAEARGKRLSNGQCRGKEKRKLGTPPMKQEDFSMILPYGLTIGNHVTPIDHQYFSPTVFNSPRDTYEVKAMADALLVAIQPRQKPDYTEYRMVFSISCTLFYYYDLVTSLDPDIKMVFDDAQGGPYDKSINIPVKEGEVIGRIGGQTLDFAVWDTEVVLAGFVIPEHYEGEAWKIHTVDPLDYYTEDLKAQLLPKYVRTAPPASGKIDYDIDGRLVGNWFKEGSGGYAGGGESFTYWSTHLSITYDAYDPESIVFSIGDFAGKPQQFGVKGNSPDPASVSVETGLLMYELVQKDWIDPATGRYWDRFSLIKGPKAKNHEENILGVALLQMIEGRRVKVEVFPGKTADQMADFTDKALIYER